MPLNTRVKRNGKPVKFDWSTDAVPNVMLTVAIAEADPDRVIAEGDRTARQVVEDGKFVDSLFMGYAIFYNDWPVPLMREGKQTLKHSHKFCIYADDNKPPVILKKGDVLEMWRD